MSYSPYEVGKGIKVATLKTVLENIGLPTTGTKAILQKRLSKGLRQPRIPHPDKKTRILSIDMGIRNLAFCVADIPPIPTPTPLTPASRKTRQEASRAMHIAAWRRIDMVKESPQSSALEEEEITMDPESEETEDAEDTSDPYAPPTLSKTAYTLLTETLLPYNPDIILIERQRWRSASSTAVQQWTVRVNTLESMLWAILTALRSHSASTSASPESESKSKSKPDARTHAYALHAIDPKAVARTCLDSTSSQTPKPPRTAKTIKTEKITLVQSWLTAPDPSTAPKPSLHFPLGKYLNPHAYPLSFTFSPAAERIRAALCAPTTPTLTRTQRASLKQAAGLEKLDDVTDCFLQAVAWVSWECNRVELGRLGWAQVLGEGEGEGEGVKGKEEGARARAAAREWEKGC